MGRPRHPVSSEALPALLVPVANSLIYPTFSPPALFQQGVGVLTRSGDHSKVLAAANDSSGELALFSSGGTVVAGPLALGAGSIPSIAANIDETRFAVVLAASGSTQLHLLDVSLS